MDLASLQFGDMILVGGLLVNLVAQRTMVLRLRTEVDNLTARVTKHGEQIAACIARETE